MALRQKIYIPRLTAFKEEVRRNPDADFTPHIQKLAAKLRAREKSFADKLFLDLYDGDTHSLKTDLCALRTSNPAEQASLPNPIELLLCLYPELSQPIKENSSTILAVCNQGAEINLNYYEIILSNFKEEVCRNPDADFLPVMKKLSEEIFCWEKEYQKHVVSLLFLNLYGQNANLLGKDLIKLQMLKPAKKAKPPERIALLPLLCGALSFYLEKDFSDLVAMC